MWLEMTGMRSYDFTASHVFEGKSGSEDRASVSGRIKRYSRERDRVPRYRKSPFFVENSFGTPGSQA